MVQLMPLWLFFAGFLSGTQFSLSNTPMVLMGGFAFYYYSLLTAKSSFKQSVLYSFMFGYGFFSYSHSWISHPLTAFGNLYASIQPIVFLGVPALFALYFVVVGALNYYIKNDSKYRMFTLALLTVGVEYARCEYAPAVPLGQVGSVWINTPWMMQGGALFGIYGLSFITVSLAYSIGNIKRSIHPFLISAGLCVSLFLWGNWRVLNTPLIITEHIVRVVPTSFEQLDKFKSVESRIDHLKQLGAGSVSPFTKKPILILWPETTIEFALLQHGMGYDFSYPDIKKYLQQMLPPDTQLLSGIVLRNASNHVYNVLFGITKTDDINYIYKKRFLAPFGEFMPPFLRQISQYLGIHAMDDFNRGDNRQDQLVLKNGVTINPIICYEGSFTGQALLPNQTSDLITISTNDAWFKYNGKEQQFISHAFRAVEEGVAIVRSANGGFSGYVSPLGTYKVSLSDKPQDIAFHKPLSETFYRWMVNHCRYWVESIFGICFVYIVLLEVLWRRRRRHL